MSSEENFLEIYETVVEQDIEKFYAADIKSDVSLNPGNIGRTIYRIADKYNLPIEIQRENPAEPSLFIFTEIPDYSEIEEMLEITEEDEEEPLDKAIRRLSESTYTEDELVNTLKDVAEEYYQSISKQLETSAKLKDQLKEEGLIIGNSIDGWTVQKE